MKITVQLAFPCFVDEEDYERYEMVLSKWWCYSVSPRMYQFRQVCIFHSCCAFSNGSGNRNLWDVVQCSVSDAKALTRVRCWHEAAKVESLLCPLKSHRII